MKKKHINNFKDKEKKVKRISKEEMFLEIACVVAKKSNCLRANIGAVIVLGDTVISTGYIGAPRGCKDSLEYGFCLRDKLGILHGQRYEICRSVHAEMNAIINAARTGSIVLGSKMYIFGRDAKNGEVIDAYPCQMCRKMIINAGIEEVIVKKHDGNIAHLFIQDWIMEWRRGDILDAKNQYGVPLTIKKEEKK